jgi:hypothetical protein
VFNLLGHWLRNAKDRLSPAARAPCIGGACGTCTPSHGQ